MKKFFTLFLAFSALTLSAQSFNMSSGCFSGTVTMAASGTVDGKTRYVATTTKTVAYDGDTYTNATLECYWLISGNNWQINVIANNRINPMSTNPSNASTPPSTGWTTPFCSITVGTIMPVELIAFDAQTTKGSNRLAWSTASEKNNQGFDIERSLDGTDFQKIGFVKGNGTTNQPQQYTYTDALVSAVTYYRLKQLDTDGNFTYSKVVSVESNGEGLRVYPTLASDGVLTVQGGQSDDFIVTNLLGQTVLMGKTTPQINVSALARGTYLLKVGSEVSKFVKQ